MQADQLDLGSKYRDTVSGWEGVAVARYEYMNGCTRVEISGADKDGKPDSYVFDVQQIEAVVPAVRPVDVERRDTGGPQDHTPAPR